MSLEVLRISPGISWMSLEVLPNISRDIQDVPRSPLEYLPGYPEYPPRARGRLPLDPLFVEPGIWENVRT